MKSLFPGAIYWVTGRSPGPGKLYYGTGPLELSLAAKADCNTRVWRQDITYSFFWHDVTSQFLDEHGRPAW